MPDLQPVYATLRALLEPYAGDLDTTRDDAAELCLNTRHVMKNGQPLFFGAVQVRKRYVSFHLMPVYTDPDLLDDLSEALRKRMQGKSCFNFTKADPALIDELRGLAERGFRRYREHGYC